MNRLWSALGPNARVRFARLRALAWLVVGAVSFPLGWADSVVLVWIASVYANAVGEVGAAEAADDKVVLDELAALRQRLDQMFESGLPCACGRGVTPSP